MLSDRCLSVCVSVPQFSAHLLRPNGCMGQDVTWYGARPQPGDFVLDGDPARAKTTAKFSAHVYCDQTAGCIKMAHGVEVGLGPIHIVLDGDTAVLPQKGTEPPNFRPIFIAAKRLDASRCHLVWR